MRATQPPSPRHWHDECLHSRRRTLGIWATVTGRRIGCDCEKRGNLLKFPRQRADDRITRSSEMAVIFLRPIVSIFLALTMVWAGGVPCLPVHAGPQTSKVPCHQHPRCSCGEHCACGERCKCCRAPARENQPPLPNRSVDRDQPLGMAETVCCDLLLGAARDASTGFLTDTASARSQTLVALAVRINC